MKNMKKRTIATVIAALSVPAAINLYILACTISTLCLSGAAAALGDVDFYFNLFLFGPFAVILSIAGFLLSGHAEPENQQVCRIGFAINAAIPVALYAVFKIMW